MSIENGPKGLGIWTAFNKVALERFGGPRRSWGVIAARMRDLGVLWLAPKVGDGGRDGTWTVDAAREAIAECHSVGVRVYPWWYSRPARIDREAELAASLLEDGADGVIVDAEIEWTGHAERASAFGERVRALVGDEAYVAHAPMAGISYHPTWPWEAFGRWVDQVMPQAYWTELLRGRYDETERKILSVWDELAAGGDVRARAYAPIGCTYGTAEVNALVRPPGAFSAEDLRRFLDRYSGHPTVSLYSLEVAHPSALEVLAERLAELRDRPTAPSLDALEGVADGAVEAYQRDRAAEDDDAAK